MKRQLDITAMQTLMRNFQTDTKEVLDLVLEFRYQKQTFLRDCHSHGRIQNVNRRIRLADFLIQKMRHTSNARAYRHDLRDVQVTASCDFEPEYCKNKAMYLEYLNTNVSE